MKTKTFDCVEMKRRGAELVQERLAGMTPEQELEFWRQQTEELRREQQRVRTAHRAQPKTR
jgi:hypothetical protein